MASTRKTRSQLALPDLDHEILGRSPLKQARIALKHNVNAGPTMTEDTPSEQETREDHDVPAKRPSSPLKDTVALRERDLKRARHEGADGENGPARTANHALSSHRKTPSTSSAPSTSTDYTPIRVQRALSMPPDTTTPIPHLDLNRIPPSPWRTPGLKLQITPVLSLESIPDATNEPQPPPDVVMATPTTNALALPLPAPAAAVGMADADPTEELVDSIQPRPSSASPNGMPPTSSPLPSLPTSPVDEQPPATDIGPETPRRSARLEVDAPMSPLTPLPTTLWIPKEAVPPSKGDVLQGKQADVSEPPLPPKTPMATTSRLPKPTASIFHSALAAVASPNTGVKPKTVSRVRAMKARQPPAQVSLGGRMTRSAALRSIVTKKKEEPAVTEVAKPISRPSINPVQSTDTQAPPIQATAAAAKTPGRRRSMSFSYAMPTTSSAAKSNPGSPTKPHSTIGSSSNMRSFTFSRASQPPAASSLSNLSQALEKLNLPPPARPNTSMGFNREGPGGGDTDDDDDAPARSTLSKDDNDIAMRSSGSQGTAKRLAAPQLKRASTIGPSTRPGPSSSSKTQPPTHSKLMLPPPVPKSKTATPSSSAATEPPKKINLQSGMVVGKPKGNFTFGGAAGSSSKARIFGAGTLSGAGSKGRVIHRVSKQSSLPSVEGSPVKGGGSAAMEEEMDVEEPVAGPSSLASAGDVKEVTSDMGSFLAGPASLGFGTPTTLDSSAGAAAPLTNGELPESSGSKESDSATTGSWKTNASRRASMASQLLSQSLSSIPKTPPKPVLPATEGKGKGRAGLRSSSSTYPSGQGMRTAPGALGKAGISDTNGTANGAHVSKTKTGAGASTSGSLKVLKDCTIFVDVRTDDGDDAGALFVDMLRGMGAKMLTRVGQSCTHIVYKNGLTSTLTRYRLLHEPRPLVVGIAWVVECVEQRVKVEETKFLVDLEHVNVAGSSKRRRSMLPKSLSGGNLEPRDLPSPAASTEGKLTNYPDLPIGTSKSSPVLVTDESPKGAGDDLTPLERARRRHNTIKNMFSRT
ncbi:hypothetical protein BXZ70DRAFT_955488 [Cristinia sonorae]|uniref:BRCT domain-containing protein n=1 Tax=Cristinia sonorae TaxID=1940300 RepID=A0A8K0UG64_9AGAR|nr:hypothetical protein BXZ70DRAFT_955488 [Cristinia sonorae]